MLKRRNASTWAGPMKPDPMMPARKGLSIINLVVIICS